MISERKASVASHFTILFDRWAMEGLKDGNDKPKATHTAVPEQSQVPMSLSPISNMEGKQYPSKYRKISVNFMFCITKTYTTIYLFHLYNFKKKRSFVSKTDPILSVSVSEISHLLL